CIEVDRRLPRHWVSGGRACWCLVCYLFALRRDIDYLLVGQFLSEVHVLHRSIRQRSTRCPNCLLNPCSALKIIHSWLLDCPLNIHTDTSRRPITHRTSITTHKC